MSTHRRYHPFYCEENAWWLCQDDSFAGRDPEVVFITNRNKQCLLLEQRASPPGEPVVWDYHVIVVAQGEVWDLDTRLGMPLSVGVYLDKTFPPLPAHMAAMAPMFRCVPAAELLGLFRTDRSHMRSGDGWIQPPPPWAPPGRGAEPNQLRFVDLDDDVAGHIVDLRGLRARYSR